MVKSFKCRLCDLTFDSETRLIVHIEQTPCHSRNAMCHCDGCNPSLSKLPYNDSQRKYNPKLPPPILRTCEPCGGIKLFLCCIASQRHITSTSHKSNAEAVGLECISSGATFYTAEQHKRHLADRHRTDIQYYCIECLTDFPSHCALNEHLKTYIQHDRRNVGILCKPCGELFKTGLKYDAHINKQVHKNSLRLVRCLGFPKCWRTFTNEANMIAHLESGTCASGMNSHYIDEQVQQRATSKELSTANTQPSITVSTTSLSLQPVIAAASLADFDPLCVKIQGTSLSDVSLPLFGALEPVSYSPGETPTSITAVSVSSRSAITAVNPVAATTSKVSESSRSRLSGFNTLRLDSGLDGMVLQASFLGDIGGGSGIENEEQSKQKDLRRSALLELEKLAKRRDSSRTMPSTSTPGQSSDGESSAELVAWPESVVWPETEATSPESLRVSETKPATVMSILAELETLTGTPWNSVFTYLDNVWSIVPEGQWYVYIEILDMLCHPQEELSRRGFTLAPFTEKKFESMQKCIQCRNGNKTVECRIHSGRLVKIFNHQARKVERSFSCCKAALVRGNITGCATLPSHSFESLPDLALNWTFLAAPPPLPGLPKRWAVVLDCEMCGADFNRSELILLSVVDFFTAEVLINSLVKPSVPVMSWRTQYSGVSENMMREAVAAGNYIDGWQGARALLFQYIDKDTIIMGHSLHYDLDQLRLIHQKVIDSSMLIPKLKSSKHGVQGLSAELLRKQVQRGGRYGHDCLEDTLATRELIIWCLRNPVDFVARKMQSDKERAQAEAEYLLKIEKRAEREGLSKEQQEIRGDTREAVGKENSEYQEETMKTSTGAN